jgi:hypothetical protein
MPGELPKQTPKANEMFVSLGATPERDTVTVARKKETTQQSHVLFMSFSYPHVPSGDSSSQRWHYLATTLTRRAYGEEEEVLQCWGCAPLP